MDEIVRRLSWPGQRRGYRKRHDPGRGPKVLLGLLGLLVATWVVAGVAGGLADSRRTAEAPATITGRRLQVGGGAREQLPRGYHLEYVYLVRGIEHRGAAFRQWPNLEAIRPKVCHDPSNPDDHLLVQGTFRCGTGDRLLP